MWIANSSREPTFFQIALEGEASRVDIAQKPNKRGQILDQRWKIFFVIFTKLIPREIFFCIANILVLMVFADRSIFNSQCVFPT